MYHSLQESGFTLIELIMVIALIGYVITFDVVINTETLVRTQVTEERNLIVSLVFGAARAHALANVYESSHGIHIDTSRHEYVLFLGDTYKEDASTNRTIPFTSNTITVTNTNEDDIVFEALSGNVTRGFGTITIRSQDIEQEIVLSRVGQINW